MYKDVFHKTHGVQVNILHMLYKEMRCFEIGLFLSRNYNYCYLVEKKFPYWIIPNQVYKKNQINM